MPPAGFETAVPTRWRSQTHALDLTATGIGNSESIRKKNVLSTLAKAQVQNCVLELQ